MELTGRIDEYGKMKIHNRAMLDQWIEKHKNKSVCLKVEVKKKKRSNLQNDFYWGVCVPIIKDALYELGNDFSAEDVHALLKAKFNTTLIANADGVAEEIVVSTTKLSTTEFMAYIAKIQQWAAEFLGIVIPDPGSSPEIDFYIAHHDNQSNVTIVEKG